jgi:hypothetical protein
MPLQEDAARAALIERLLVKEAAMQLGANPAEARMLLGTLLLPPLCALLTQLERMVEDDTHSPLAQQDFREALESTFRSGRNATHSAATSMPICGDCGRSRVYQLYPCARLNGKPEPGVLLLGDGQARFVPQAGGERVAVLLHNVSLQATGARGLRLTLTRHGVAAGAVLELRDLIDRDETLRAAAQLRHESLERDGVWELALSAFAAVARHAEDQADVIAQLVQAGLVRTLCTRLAMLQRPEVRVHGGGGDGVGSAADDWGTAPSDSLGTATVRRSEADTRLALHLLDALRAVVRTAGWPYPLLHCGSLQCSSWPVVTVALVCAAEMGADRRGPAWGDITAVVLGCRDSGRLRGNPGARAVPLRRRGACTGAHRDLSQEAGHSDQRPGACAWAPRSLTDHAPGVQIYAHDGQRSSAHVLWCRILRFVGTVLHIYTSEYHLHVIIIMIGTLD